MSESKNGGDDDTMTGATAVRVALRRAQVCLGCFSCAFNTPFCHCVITALQHGYSSVFLAPSLSAALCPHPARSFAVGGGRPASDWAAFASTATGDALGAAASAAAVAAAVAAGTVKAPADPTAALAAAMYCGAPFSSRISAWMLEMSGMGLQPWPAAGATETAPPATEPLTKSQLLSETFAPPPILRLAPPPLPFGDAADALDDEDEEGAEGGDGEHAAAAAATSTTSIAAGADAATAEAGKATAAAAAAGGARAPGNAPKLFEERFLPQLVRAVHGSAEGIEKLRARFR